MSPPLLKPAPIHHMMKGHPAAPRSDGSNLIICQLPFSVALMHAPSLAALWRFCRTRTPFLQLLFTNCKQNSRGNFHFSLHFRRHFAISTFGKREMIFGNVNNGSRALVSGLILETGLFLCVCLNLKSFPGASSCFIAASFAADLSCCQMKSQCSTRIID